MADFDLEIAELNTESLLTFGDDVTYTAPGEPTGYDVPGVLDFSAEARQRKPGIAGTCFVRLADFIDAPVKNGIIEVAGVEYKIADDPQDERDGQGATILFLRRK